MFTYYLKGFTNTTAYLPKGVFINTTEYMYPTYYSKGFTNTTVYVPKVFLPIQPSMYPTLLHCHTIIIDFQ